MAPPAAMSTTISKNEGPGTTKLMVMGAVLGPAVRLKL